MRRSFLIDTNVIIHLEDSKPVGARFADLTRLCSQHSIPMLVHEASEEDIMRDADPNRRATTLSKIAKFEVLRDVPTPPKNELEQRFGSISSENDLVDVTLLYTLDRGVADFLITEDLGLHKRARDAGLSDRTLRVAEACEWLERTFEPATVQLRYVIERKCYQLNPADPIFNTLREDYPDFDEWFKKVQMRPCWVLDINGESAGIIIRKDHEPRQETDATLPGDRILKISTFKVREEYRGEKLGELLLKQALWHAQTNRYGVVYLTAFPGKQKILIDLLTQFGFVHTITKGNGELVLEKQMGSGPVTDTGAPLELDIKHYPRFVEDRRVEMYAVPILPQWHRRLFPESDPQTSLLDPPQDADRTPGNTIRKVYLCRTPLTTLKPGDILLFYVSGDSVISGTVRTLGVVEGFKVTTDADELSRLTGRRSVYSQEDQINMIKDRSAPVKVIDFLLVGHFANPIPLEELIQIGALKSWPQSLTKIKETGRAKLFLNERLGY